MVQVNNTPITVRVRFTKVGRLQYISHLDLVRTMMKIIVRANLPLWYTEGFNPKPKLSFAAPLSIGTESYCEFMDIRLTERIDEQAVLDALNRNLTDEMRAVEAYYPTSKMTELKWLGYTVIIDTVGADEDLVCRCRDLFDGESLMVEKKTKSGIASVNIKPLIKNIDVSFEDGLIKLECVLSADSAGFLNPEYVIKVMKDSLGILYCENIIEEGYSILRHSAYREDMSKFV